MNKLPYGVGLSFSSYQYNNDYLDHFIVPGEDHYHLMDNWEDIMTLVKDILTRVIL